MSPEINLDTRVVLQETEELRPLSSLPWCPRCPREMLTCCCTTAEGPESAHRHPPLHCQQIQLAATYSCRRMAACWLSSTTSSTCWCKMPSFCGEKSTRNEWRASDTSVVFLKMLVKALVVLLICVMDCVPSARTAWKMVNQVPGLSVFSVPLAVGGSSKRKRCQGCSVKKDCKMQKVCGRCSKYICRGCAVLYYSAFASQV